MPLIGTDGHPLSLSLALARSLPLANPNSAQLQLCAATHASLEQHQPEHARTRAQRDRPIPPASGPSALAAAPRLDASTDIPRSSRGGLTAWPRELRRPDQSHSTHPTPCRVAHGVLRMAAMRNPRRLGRLPSEMGPPSLREFLPGFSIFTFQTQPLNECSTLPASSEPPSSRSPLASLAGTPSPLRPGRLPPSCCSGRPAGVCVWGGWTAAEPPRAWSARHKERHTLR